MKPRTHRIVFLDRSTVDATFRPPSFPHTWTEHEQSREDQVVERLRDATIAITNKVPIRGAALEVMEHLAFIAVAATGVDIIDLPAASARGVTVANVRRYAMSSVPEHAMMLALALRRNLLAYREDVTSGAWSRSSHFCLLGREIGDLRGATLGVVGYGALGRATAELAAAFGMHILIAEHKGSAETRSGRTPFEVVLAESDVISLHASLTPDTRHLISTAELRRMKPTAFLINTARGGLVDEAALHQALAERRIAGVGLDVLDAEPPRATNPLLSLADRPNVIITPHIAWASRTSMQALADQVVDNIEAFVRGEPKNLVS